MGAGGWAPLTLTTERDVCRGSLASSGAQLGLPVSPVKSAPSVQYPLYQSRPARLTASCGAHNSLSVLPCEITLLNLATPFNFCIAWIISRHCYSESATEYRQHVQNYLRSYRCTGVVLKELQWRTLHGACTTHTVMSVLCAVPSTCSRIHLLCEQPDK